MSADDDFVVFKDDGGLSGPAESNQPDAISARQVPCWRILIVDDDADVHSATEFALSGLEILGRPLCFLHAYSAAEAIETLMSETDVAVILLDVVMETEEAGLSVVSTIRTDLGLTQTQIILRTGQPGYAPELETIRRYDINDYRTKSELSRVKLYTALTASIRSYDQLRNLERARLGIENVARAGAAMFAAGSASAAIEVLLRQAAGLLSLEPVGLVCDIEPNDEKPGIVLASIGNGAVATGLHIADLSMPSLPHLSARLTQAARERRSLIDADGYTLYLPANRSKGLLAYLPNPDNIAPVPRALLEMFCSNVAVCAENLALVERLSDIAFKDSLTGLASRRAFVDELNRRLNEGSRGNVALMLLDVDQFAETNDMFGHRYGDELLRGIAARLRQALPADVLVARLAADSFALLGTTTQLNAGPIRKLFVTPFPFEGEQRMVSISSSLVKASEAEESADGNELLKDASIVIKRAKAQGLGRHVIYTRQFHDETRDHSRTLHELSLAFSRRELYIVYQPQISLSDRTVIGVEALIRWRAADGSSIPPDRFIPIAEKSGLIQPIGNWVLSTAVEALLVLQKAGYADLRMAVNVSVKQLSTNSFVNHLDSTLRDSGINPEQLELEVTESLSVLGFDEMYAQLMAFRQRGVALAIDDFGTGYSSLSYLDRLPADRLKIDRAFVTALTQESDAPRIAEMVIPLGRQLKMQVLAEGVETEQQAELLKEMGCDEAQGYLFARPMPLDDLLVWLASHH